MRGTTDYEYHEMYYDNIIYEGEKRKMLSWESMD
jgi:hypothetical protein